MKHYPDFAMDLVGQEILYQKNGAKPERQLVTGTVLTDKDILLHLKSGEQVFFSNAHLIINEFPVKKVT